MAISRAVRHPRSFLTNSIQMYRTLLTDPATFYDEYLGPHGITREFLLVLVLGAVGVAGNLFALTRLRAVFETLDVPISGDTSFALWESVVAPLVGMVGLWIGLTTALYAVGWLYSGLGEYYVLLKRSAWALVPLVFANLLHTIAVAYAAFTLTPGSVDASMIPRPANARAEFVWQQVAGDPVVVATVLVSVVFVAWMGYIGAYAVRDVRGLQTNEAFRVAAVPTVAYALYVVYEGATALL